MKPLGIALIVSLACLSTVWTAHGQAARIVIKDADATCVIKLAVSSQWPAEEANTGLRIIVRSVDALRQDTTVARTGGVVAQTTNTQARIVVRGADALRQDEVGGKPEVPVAQAPDTGNRIIVRSVDALRQEVLTRPPLFTLQAAIAQAGTTLSETATLPTNTPTQAVATPTEAPTKQVEVPTEAPTEVVETPTPASSATPPPATEVARVDVADPPTSNPSATPSRSDISVPTTGASGLLVQIWGGLDTTEKVFSIMGSIATIGALLLALTASRRR